MTAPPDPSPSAPGEQPALGLQLRRLREQRGLSLDEAARALTISRAILRALEASAYEQLPADVFVKAHLSCYASWLGLEGSLAAERFFLERDEAAPEAVRSLALNAQHLTPKKLAEPTRISSAALAALLLGLIVLSFSAFCFYVSWNPFAFLSHKPASKSLAQNAFHPADPATAAHRPPLELVAVFTQEATVRASTDAKNPHEQNYAKGSKVRWQAAKQIRVEFFQPDSAELLYNGAPLPFPAPDPHGRFLLRLNAPRP